MPNIVEITPWLRTLEYTSAWNLACHSFSFAVIADAHCAETSASIRHGKGLEHLGNGAQRLQRCLDAIRELRAGERPSFAILLGDIGLEAAENVLEDPPCAIHAIAGNHDWGPRRAQLRQQFPYDFGSGDSISDYYAFEHAGVRFIAICNAGTGNEHTGQLSSEDIHPPGQSAWIRSELQQASAVPMVLLGHCPPQPLQFDATAYLKQASHTYLPFMGDCDSDFLNQQLRTKGAIAAFFGHLHRATYHYKLGTSRIHVLRSCNWNHDAQPLGFAQVRVDRSGIEIREILTGRYV